MQCPREQTLSSYGDYIWDSSDPESILNFTCKYNGSNSNPVVMRICNERGQWKEVDYTQCWTKAEEMLSKISPVSYIAT